MKKYTNLFIIFAFVSILFVTFSYSAFNTNLYVEGSGIIRAQADVRVNGIVTSEYYGSAIENFNPNYNVDRTTLSVDLPTVDSKIKYYVTIKNYGNKVFIPEIELLSEKNDNVIIKISDENNSYNLPNDDILFSLNANEEKIYTLEISNKSGTTNEDVVVSLKYNYVYDNVTSPIIALSNDGNSIELLSAGTSTFNVKNYEYYISETDITVDENTVATNTTSGTLDLNTIDLGSYYVWYRTISTKDTKSVWSNKVKVERKVKITYVSNGGSECTSKTVIKGKTWGNLCKSTKTDLALSGWYTDNNTFKNKITSTTVATKDITVYAKWVDGVAKIGDKKYATLQDAVTDAPNNTQTTIVLIADTSEAVSIGKLKNIVLDIQNYTISNDGNKAVIENAGTLSISNGILTSSAPKNAVINNTGTLNVSGGEIIATGDRQAIYNNGGTTTISGNAYLTSSTSQRACVHNLNKGKMTITGGTIISTGFYGLTNPISDGTLIIGNKDGIIDKTTPVIQGITYGVNSSGNFEFHDGIIKGTTKPFNNNNYVKVLENASILDSTEVINGISYHNAYLGVPITITYNANGGNVSPTSVKMEKGTPIGNIPTPTKAGHRFDGWFTESSGGTQITSSFVPTGDIEIFAHWTKIIVAQIGETQYGYIKDAVTAAGKNPTTIKIINNPNEAVTIGTGQNITIDLQNGTLGSDGSGAVFENNGALRVINGTITSNSNSAAINNNDGATLIIDNGARIIATGPKQAIYNLEGGYVEIKEGSYLSSVTSGKYESSSLERATVQNLSGGTIVITGGEIVNTVQQAISNEGTMTIGVKDNSINKTTPIIKGETHAIQTIGTLNIYDGVLKGITGAIDGTINDIEDNSHIVNDSEVIDSKTYNVEYYEFD